MPIQEIVRDEQGHARYLKVQPDPEPAAKLAFSADHHAASPQESARNFLTAHADVIGLATESTESLHLTAAETPSGEDQALRFESEKTIMGTSTVSYVQTMFGLPVYQAGISVTT